MGKFDKAFAAEDGEKSAEQIAKLIRHKLTHIKDVEENCDEDIRKVNKIFFFECRGMDAAYQTILLT